MKVAIVHDYLNQMGGAESIIELFHEEFPEAPIFTSIYDPERMPERFRTMDIRTTWMQKLPLLSRLFRLYFPLYPFAFESIDLRGYDVVISCTTAWTKGILTDPSTCHVCYINTPMRFAWRPFDYLESENIPGPLRPLLSILFHTLRIWDISCIRRTDFLIGNSGNVANRIRKFYDRTSRVIYPPVDTDKYHISPEPEDYYLIISRSRAYKRIDIAIDAAMQLGLSLKIVGDGPDRRDLELRAQRGHPGQKGGQPLHNIEFLGHVDDDDLADLIAHARALIVTSEEDFGITPLEANASGRPVIAYAAGGALETVIPANGYPDWVNNKVDLEQKELKPTGVFYFEKSVDSLVSILKSFDPTRFVPDELRAHAMRFDNKVFRRYIREFVTQCHEKHQEKFSKVEHHW